MGFWSFISGAIETTLDLASEFLPGSKLLLKAGKKFATAVGKTAGGLAKGVGMVKDLAADISLGNLSTSVGNLKDGLAQAQGEIESKSQELTENIHQLRAELERQKEDLANQLKSQESRLETRLVDEIRQQEAKITQLQAETKKQLVEEQKKLLEAAIQKLEAAQQNINRTTQGQIQATEAKLAEFNQELDRVKDEQKEVRNELNQHAEILRWHEQRLNSFAQEMENIKQEVNQRMDQLEGKTEQALQLAQQTSQRVEALAAQMAKTQDKVAKLEKQVQQNQQAIQQAREEVQRTNQRLDDFIKRQELMDFSAQQLVFDKIQKTLANKAEEAKLLATLNLLEETKSLLPEEEIPVAGAKTANQPVISLLQSLISALEGQESVRRPSEYKPREDRDLSEYRRSEIDAEQPEEAKDREKVNTNLEKLEEMKKEVLERLQPVQQAIKQDLEALENRKETKPTRNQEQISRQYRINKTQKELTELEEKDNNQSKSNAEKERIARELQQKREELETLQKQQAFVEQLAEQEQKVLQTKKQELAQQWKLLQGISQPLLNPESLAPEVFDPQELTEEIQEKQQDLSAHKAQMTWLTLLIILFLLEKVIYDKNGVLGLVILNTILAILYYYKDAILAHQHLWQTYALLIGYIIGNALAYSVVEKKEHKWAAIAGFNAIILSIWGYTWWQDSRTTQQVAQLEQQIAKGAKNFQARQEQSKAAAIKRQKERLAQINRMKQQLVAENLSKAQTDLNNLPQRMTWEKIKQKYPEFEKRSLFLQELKQIAEKILKKEEDPVSKFLDKLARSQELWEREIKNLEEQTRIKPDHPDWETHVYHEATKKFTPPVSEEEQQLLTQLLLTEEQQLAICDQVKSLTTQERKILREKYPLLADEIKLRLLNAGLNACEINTYEKKLIFLNLNHQLHEEKKNWQPTLPQKEAILRLLLETLELSKEQKGSLEQMGVSLFNASNWQVQEQQKNNLIHFGCQKITLTTEQKAVLLTRSYPEGLKAFRFEPEQKHLLQTLAPLTQEYKYSLAAKALLNSLDLPPAKINFLVREEISPNPHTEFGEPQNPYLPCKLQYLLGQQKILRAVEKVRQEQLQQQETLFVKTWHW